MKSSSLNFHDSASTALIDDYYKTLQDVINCQQAPAVKHQDSEGNRWYKILVKIKQFVVLIMRTHVLSIAQREAFSSPEVALLLVSTKNRDLWPCPTTEVRNSRTSRHSAHALSQV